MVKIDKRYTITFYYAGVKQTPQFSEVDGVLYNPTLMVSYYKDKLPDVSVCKTIDEVLSIIKKIAYCGNAEITHINGYPLFYYDKKEIHKLIDSVENEYRNFIETKSKEFFVAILYPILMVNEWKLGRSGMTGQLVLVSKDENGEWDNVNDKDKEYEFEFLCKVFLRSIGIDADRWAVTNLLGLAEEKINELNLEIE